MLCCPIASSLASFREKASSERELEQRTQWASGICQVRNICKKNTAIYTIGKKGWVPLSQVRAYDKKWNQQSLEILWKAWSMHWKYGIMVWFDFVLGYKYGPCMNFKTIFLSLSIQPMGSLQISFVVWFDFDSC